MKPLRLVLVTPRFWPLIGRPQKVMGDLAVELAGRGCRVMILAARWRPNWPPQILYHDVPVLRLSPPPQGAWKTRRYLRSLERWLRTNQQHYDLVYVSGLRHEAYAATEAIGGRVPVVLRAERAGRFGDCLGQIDSFAGRRIKRQCMKAAALIGPSHALRRELEAAGYPRARIHYLPNGVTIPPPRTPSTQFNARSVLADADDGLRVPDWARLAVFAGRLEPHKGLAALIDAWKPLLARWSNARLWLAGDGPEQANLGRQIEQSRLTANVALVGLFDQLDTLLAAADLFVLPSGEASTSLSLIEAMAAGTPIIAGDTSSVREVIDGGASGLLVPPADANALAAAAGRLLDQPDSAARLGAAARDRAIADFTLAKMVDRHVTLFEELTGRRASTT